MMRVAAVQVAPAFLGLSRSLERLEEWTGKAAARGAQLVVLGETWLPGHPAWLDSSPITRESLTLDVSGQYSRPDLFEFKVRASS